MACSSCRDGIAAVPAAISTEVDGQRLEGTTDGDGVRLWAGHVKDSFYIDLSLLAIVNGAVANGTALDLSAWRPDNAQNSFAGSTVRTIVLEVPHQAGASNALPQMPFDRGAQRSIQRSFEVVGQRGVKCFAAHVGVRHRSSAPLRRSLAR